MARTALPIVALEQDTAVNQATGTAVDPENDHVINAAFDLSHEDVVVDIDSTFEGAKTFTFVGRDTDDNLVVSLNAKRAIVVPGSKFKQDDNTIHIDVEAAATGTIRVYSLSAKIA